MIWLLLYSSGKRHARRTFSTSLRKSTRNRQSRLGRGRSEPPKAVSQLRKPSMTLEVANRPGKRPRHSFVYKSCQCCCSATDMKMTRRRNGIRLGQEFNGVTLINSMKFSGLDPGYNQQRLVHAVMLLSISSIHHFYHSARSFLGKCAPSCTLPPSLFHQKMRFVLMSSSGWSGSRQLNCFGSLAMLDWESSSCCVSQHEVNPAECTAIERSIIPVSMDVPVTDSQAQYWPSLTRVERGSRW